jgi:uncharacterized membrane protein (DUF4010 family)
VIAVQGWSVIPELSPEVIQWPFVATLLRLLLALAVGIFVGLEREHRAKAGARTFACAALVGWAGGMLGDSYSLLCLGFVAMIVAFMNLRQVLAQQKLGLTTSLALLLVGIAGVMCGKGHVFTPVALTVLTAGLLAWKQPLSGFVTGLSDVELRSAILLALLAFVIYPVLPTHALDPWGIVEPRSTWATVILIAALGFVNYILWKVYGPRGLEIAAFFGGLVNSTAAVAELANRLREAGARLIGPCYRGVLIATAAMIVRNGLLLGMLAPRALLGTIVPMLAMLAASLALAFTSPPRGPVEPPVEEAGPPLLDLKSPFSLLSALKFGVLFLVLRVTSSLGQRLFGTLGFYAATFAGGLVSSASAVAAAATLARQGDISSVVAGNAAVLAALTSALVNLPMIVRSSPDRAFTRRIASSIAIVAFIGLAGIFARHVL